jgi:hypothetical protein
MSRSRRKTPGIGMCGDKSEKCCKRRWNRTFRHAAKQAVSLHHEALLPVFIKKETELWDGAKDGKVRFDPKSPWGVKLMRK